MPDEHLHLPYSASRGIPYEFESQAFAADGILWHARYDLAGNATFTEGRYTLASGLLMSLSRGNDACQVDRATVDIANIDFTGPDDELSLLDLTMDVHCQSASGNTTRGRLTFRDRDDLTAPAAVSGLTAARDGRQVTLTWTNPGAPDLAGVLVRWYPGPIAPTATDVGRAAYLGTGTSTGFDALGTGPVAVSVWTFDTSGNVGAPRSLVVGAAAATPDRHVPIPRTAPPPVRRPVGLLRLAR